MTPSAQARAYAFARRYGLSMAVLMAPMAGVPSLPLATAVAEAGAMATLGGLLFEPPALSA